jgi:hypothetical protein
MWFVVAKFVVAKENFSAPNLDKSLDKSLTGATESQANIPTLETATVWIFAPSDSTEGGVTSETL